MTDSEWYDTGSPPPPGSIHQWGAGTITSAGQGSATVTDISGTVHVTYVANGELYIAEWSDAAGWVTHLIERNPLSGEVNAGCIRGNVSNLYLSALRYGSELHVFYRSIGRPSFPATGERGANVLRHAWTSGAAGGPWTCETLDGIAVAGTGRVSANVGVSIAAVLMDGVPHVFYGDATNADLRHSWWDNSGGTWHWSAETLDGAGGVAGRTANALVPPGTSGFSDSANGGHFIAAFEKTFAPNSGLNAVYYTDFTTGDLRHAYQFPGGSWNFGVYDGDVSDGTGRISTQIGNFVDALEFQGQEHAFYRDESNGDLRHFWFDGSSHAETLDGSGGWGGYATTFDVGRGISSIVFQNKIHLIYDAWGGAWAQHLSFDMSTGRSYTNETIDGSSSYTRGQVSGGYASYGILPSVRVDQNGFMQVFYSFNNVGLRFSGY